MVPSRTKCTGRNNGTISKKLLETYMREKRGQNSVALVLLAAEDIFLTKNGRWRVGQKG